MVAPVIMKFGLRNKKLFFFQRFSIQTYGFVRVTRSPDQASDLASLRTQCAEQGDNFIINGVKTWTTMAQYADWMFCLVRSSTEEIPQLGISFVLIDMRSEGISVKPIVTLDKPERGHQEINTVYFENVSVPKENLVGELGKGWTYAKYLWSSSEAMHTLQL